MVFLCVIVDLQGGDRVSCMDISLLRDFLYSIRVGSGAVNN